MVPLDPPTLVSDSNALAQLCGRLAQAGRISVDTESNSMHAYTERVCLVQITALGADYLVDPLAVDIGPLRDVFADPTRVKILHAAEGDVMCLRRDFGFVFDNLFDTMLAARILGWKQLGLGGILARLHGVELDKRMQRHDWGRRPLGAAAIDYARLDTHFLEPLRDHLAEQLADAERTDEAQAAFVRVARAHATPRAWDPDGFWELKGARGLDPTGTAVLCELYRFREQLARRLDRPLFKVIGNEVLVAMASDPPRTREDLARIRGMPRQIVERNAGALLDAVRTGHTRQPPPAPARAHRTPRTDVDRRFDRLRDWRREQALARDVEADVILGKRELVELAQANPNGITELERAGILDAWQLRSYGEQLLQVLRSK